MHLQIIWFWPSFLLSCHCPVYLSPFTEYTVWRIPFFWANWSHSFHGGSDSFGFFRCGIFNFKKSYLRSWTEELYNFRIMKGYDRCLLFPSRHKRSSLRLLSTLRKDWLHLWRRWNRRNFDRGIKQDSYTYWWCAWSWLEKTAER